MEMRIHYLIFPHAPLHILQQDPSNRLQILGLQQPSPSQNGMRKGCSLPPLLRMGWGRAAASLPLSAREGKGIILRDIAWIQFSNCHAFDNRFSNYWWLKPIIGVGTRPTPPCSYVLAGQPDQGCTLKGWKFLTPFISIILTSMLEIEEIETTMLNLLFHYVKPGR